MFLHSRSIALGAAVLMAGLGGCATIMAGGPDQVSVSSQPAGASVYVDGQYVGATPTIVVLDREYSSGMIRVEAEGYQPVVVTRFRTINGWFWANLCIGGVVGIVVDLITGDVKRFDDSPVHVALSPGFDGREPPPPSWDAPPSPDWDGPPPEEDPGADY